MTAKRGRVRIVGLAKIKTVIGKGGSSKRHAHVKVKGSKFVGTRKAKR